MCNSFGYKYDWVIPIKDKKGVSIVNAFKSIIDTIDRYGLSKVVSFTITLFKIFWK